MGRFTGIGKISLPVILLFAVAAVLISGSAGAQRYSVAARLDPVMDGSVRVLKGPDSDAIYMQLQSGKPKFTLIEQPGGNWEKGEVIIEIDGFSTTSSPGDPMLPYKIYQLALPPDAVPASINIEITRRVEVEMPRTYRVAAAPPLAACPGEIDPKEEFLREMEKWGPDKIIRQGRNVAIYDQSEFYPEKNCTVNYSGMMRKWKTASVLFWPLRYNPSTDKLLFTSQVDLKVTFNRDTTYLQRPEMKTLLRDDIFDTRAGGMFLNYETAKEWYKLPILKEAGLVPPEDPDYVVITTDNTFSNSTKLDDFCFHKEDMGHEVIVVTEHQVHTVNFVVGAGYSFTSAPGGYEDVAGAAPPNQRPEKVRKWLRDNYAALGIEYVLLVGDPDPDNMGDGDHIGDLPMKDCQLHLFADVPTDFYFAELSEAAWDLDGDGYVGEYYSPAGQKYMPAGVTENLYCVRWEGVLDVSGAAVDVNTRITVSSDGQTKVWLDQDNDGFTDADVIHDTPGEHWPASSYYYFMLGNGQYPVKIEYIQSGGDAYCSVSPRNWVDGVTTVFKHDDGTGTFVAQLDADFFNNNDFSGAPVAEWHDRQVYTYSYAGDKGAGGMDFHAEVNVGRIPCYDQDEDGSLDWNVLDGILDKTIAYENADITQETWRRRVLTNCPYVADSDDPDFVHDIAKYEWSEMLMDNVAPPPLWEWYRIYEEVYADVFPAAEVDDGCTVAKTLTGWNDAADPDDGRGVVMWMTHGWRQGATKVFDNASCASLDDTKPSIVFMGACTNGQPEFDAAGPSLGYANLINGAVATVSASRTSYG